MSDESIDLGSDHAMRFVGWSPDRDINPQYDGIPDVEKFGAVIDHKKPDGSTCSGMVTFEGEVQAKIAPDSPRWNVLSWEPLTLDPSILCKTCGDHGYIRDGRWVA